MAGVVTSGLRKGQPLSSGIKPTYSQTRFFKKTLETCVDEHLEWLEPFGVSNVKKRTNYFYDLDDGVPQACFEYVLDRDELKALYAFKVCLFMDQMPNGRLLVLPTIFSQITVTTPDSCSVTEQIEKGNPCNVIGAASYLSKDLREFFITKKEELDGTAFDKPEYELE